MMNVAKAIGGVIGSLAATLRHVATPRDTVLYPEQKP